MKEIKLNKLVIENFKCFQLLEINFNGQDMIVKGANGTGKTTIMDAINWLLFKKNSQGNQDFSVKPLDHYGNTKKSLVISVYGEFDVDGETVSLKRTMEEQWTRKRGATEATFTGNTYSYEINNVPSKSEKEFKEFVDELCNETLFRLITNPHYFSSLDKKEKRKILIDSLKETLTDAEIVANDAELVELKEYVNTYTIEELQAVKKAELKKLTKQLNDYVPRIDELQRLITSESEEEDTAAIDDLNIKIDIVKEKIEQLKAANAVDDNLALINQINADILSLKNDLMIAERHNPYKLEKEKNLKQLNNELRNYEKAQMDNDFEIKQTKLTIESIEQELERYKNFLVAANNRINELRERSKAEAMQVFKQTNCPVCNAEYSPEKLEEVKERFNINKAKKLEEIKKEGLEAKELIEKTQETINLLINKLDEANIKLEDLEKKAIWFNQRIEEIKLGIANLESQPILESEAILGLKSAISEKEQELVRVKDNLSNFVDYKTKLAELEFELNTLQKQLFKHEQNIENRIRINALIECQERDAQERVNVEYLLSLCDLFVSKKCLLIEDKINKMFSYVNFKLFEKQINGGIAEVCYATVNGVPYDDVNSAGKINAGLDIIKTLQRENNVKAFIFIDNAESITDIMTMENQMITLYVSSEDKNLKYIIK